MAGGLMGSINFKAENQLVKIGSPKVYAAIHQFGGTAGRNQSVSIEARPFLLVQDEDWSTIMNKLTEYLLS
jgi:phage virion morphogenesis protein